MVLKTKGEMSSHSHFPYTGPGATTTALSPFSALHFLRSYNNLLIPQAELNQRYQELGTTPRLPRDLPTQCRSPDRLLADTAVPSFALQPSTFITSHGLIGYPSLSQMYQAERKTSPLMPRTLSTSSFGSSPPRRQRGEKKPIPCEQKDEKYFERRKRNNQAAKKSRDARKIREDQIALRATMLEHENAILRAQLITLREEAASLRQMLFLKKTAESVTQDLQICSST